MGVTHIEDPNGNTLWSPNSVEGTYTAQKTQEIVNILADLLSTITIKMEGTIDGETLANVYTKTQCDTLFVKNADFTTKIEALVAAGLILDGNSLNDVMTKLRSLWKTCYGTNFEGEIIDNNSYNVLISNLIDANTSLNNYITRIQHDIYPQNPDGSLDTGKRLFAAVSDTGTTSDLSSDFTGSSRDTLVRAINYVQSNNSSLSNTVSGVRNDLTTVSNNLGTVTNTLTATVQDIGNLENLDSDIGASDIVDALNKIYQEVVTIKGDITSLTERVEDLENRI